MDRGQGAFQSFDGLKLYQQWWKADSEAKAIIAIIHGTFEHSGRYNNISVELASSGYSVYAFDLRGHGKSEGERAFVDSFSLYLKDVNSFIIDISGREHGKPIFLLGHSLGGAIAVSFLLEYKPANINGLILSAPALKINENIASTAKIFTPLISNIFPKLKLAKFDPQFVSRDPAVVAAYNSDPLVYKGGLYAKPFSEFNNAINKIQPKLKDIDIPFLVLHGTKDRICDIEGSKQLFVESNSTEKEIKLYEDFYHELFNEPGKEGVFSDIVAWLNQRTQ